MHQKTLEVGAEDRSLRKDLLIVLSFPEHKEKPQMRLMEPQDW